jgi:hypothetical protein
MAATEDFTDNIDWIAGIAERRIQDAIGEGLFDNLPATGKPLDLQVNPFEPPGMGAVNRLLRHNRVLPPWLLLEQEIEAARSLALATLARWEAAEPNLRGTADYPKLRQSARTAYEQQMRRCNDFVLKYNYSSPFALRTPVPMMLRTRLREFDERYGADM